MTYEIIPVTPNTPEWLELRRHGIGGSDCAAAIGKSKWRSPYDIYCDKLGIGEPFKETEAMYWGKKHEQNIIDRFAETHGVIVQPDGIFNSKQYPFMRYTPDGFIKDTGALLEVKTSRLGIDFGEHGSDEVPTEYMLQVQHGMAVLGLPVTYMAVLIAGSEYREYVIEADKELQELIIEHEAAFWEKVQKRIEPDIIKCDDLNKRFRFSKAQNIEATEEIYNEVCRLHAAKNNIKIYEELMYESQNKIKLFMGEHDTLTYVGGTSATWKTTKPGKKFNVDAFKQAHPELYNEFLTTTEPQRRFLVK